MKLWHIAQWGNSAEGVNGHDTQCVVRAHDLMSAIQLAELMFSYHLPIWKNGKANVVYLLGDDGNFDIEEKLIIPIWIKPAYNLGGYDSWNYDFESQTWISFKEIEKENEKLY